MNYQRKYFIYLVAIVFITANFFVETLAFEQALPGYQFKFPRDHAAHENYKTEWWYYTGHLQTADKKHYGFELTFFRVGQNQSTNYLEKPKSAWRAKNIYMAHFAISDENNKKFYSYEKLNRDALQIANASAETYHVTNESWLAESLGDSMFIKADAPEFAIDLLLKSVKPPVLHGENGVSQKASCKGCASHYYSLTCLKTEGLLTIAGKSVPVSGIAWMDHEFGSNQLGENQIGWDWYSIQLDNNIEVMLYSLRNKNGTTDPNSSGTIIYADGSSQHITFSQFKTTSSDQWQSPVTKAKYPIGWRIEVPSLDLQLALKPTFNQQELAAKRSTDVSYWEGSCNVGGTFGKENVKGVGYVELTGYAQPFKTDI